MIPNVTSKSVRQSCEKMIPRIIPIFFSVMVLVISESAFGQNTFSLIDTSCVITGEEKGIVKPNEGEKSERKCKITGEKILCGDSTSSQETYNAFFGDGLIVARSESGNIFMLIDRSKKRYSYASAHLVIERGFLMTKQCSGKLK